MNNLNTVLIEGLLTRDPERMGPEGSSMCKIGIANNRYRFSDKEQRWIPETSFFTIQVYGAAAEGCMYRLKKGRGIRVVGKLKQYVNKYTNSEKIFIQAEHIEVQPKKVTEKQEIPTLERLQGVPIASADMRELDLEAESEAKRLEQQAQTVPEDNDAERIAEQTAEMVEDSIPVDDECPAAEEKEEEDSCDDSF
ncbi:MAG: single-stranded DNA-binding protein [Spirochaetales bacterium]|nr:single-stranded DNA-binding protein [Spirochaetales bacterium]